MKYIIRYYYKGTYRYINKPKVTPNNPLYTWRDSTIPNGVTQFSLKLARFIIKHKKQQIIFDNINHTWEIIPYEEAIKT